MAKGLLALIGTPKVDPESSDEESTESEGGGKKEKAVKALAVALKTNDWSAAADALDLFIQLSQ
jgi:hypothetical protein